MTPTSSAPAPEKQFAALDFKIREAIGDRSASRCDRCGRLITEPGQTCCNCRSCGNALPCESHFLAKPLRLADIVLAIHIRTSYDKNGFHDEDGPSWSIAIDDLVNCHWDLRQDSLDAQSDET